MRDEPGAGAAGGTGFGLLAIADRFASFEVRPGVEVVMELAGFDAALAERDLVLTGEGRIDEQTRLRQDRDRRRASGARGGRALHLLRRRRHQEGIAALAELGAIVVPDDGAAADRRSGDGRRRSAARPRRRARRPTRVAR